MGLIDFDTAHPGPRARPRLRLLPPRAKLVCDSYGFTDPRAVIDSAADRLRDIAHIEANAAQYSLS
ncbi:hypothetical protein ACFXPA_16910 [Amycolatopsis sp. NPDC059090]|uniref:hypothetical protein n=1 Tax=unclassified Amycolatopsis TaxID=2618356 RepID=UPI00366D4F87